MEEEINLEEVHDLFLVFETTIMKDNMSAL